MICVIINVVIEEVNNILLLMSVEIFRLYVFIGLEVLVWNFIILYNIYLNEFILLLVFEGFNC